MIKSCTEAERFEAAFRDYVKNRMYPPGYGKESAVTKPRLEHIAAVTRTQHLLETAINVSDNPALAKRIGKDVQLLCQVREVLYHCIENPTLPFTGEPLVDKIEDAPDEAD